jgi:hypothetical protein
VGRRFSHGAVAFLRLWERFREARRHSRPKQPLSGTKTPQLLRARIGLESASARARTALENQPVRAINYRIRNGTLLTSQPPVTNT